MIDDVGVFFVFFLVFVVFAACAMTLTFLGVLVLPLLIICRGVAFVVCLLPERKQERHETIFLPQDETIRVAPRDRSPIK